MLKATYIPLLTLMSYAKKPGRIINRAEHIYIYDTDGTEFLDAMSGLWCCSLGYSQPEIAAAVNAPVSATALLQ